MLLGIEVFDSFKVQQGISSLLIISLIGKSHCFELACSSLCHSVGDKNVYSHGTQLNDEEFP